MRLFNSSSTILQHTTSTSIRTFRRLLHHCTAMSSIHTTPLPNHIRTHTTANHSGSHTEDDTSAGGHLYEPDGTLPNLTIHTPKKSAIIFMGTGASMGIPRAGCLLPQPHTFECTTCPKAIQGKPELNRDYRGNPSLFIRYYNPTAAVQLQPKPVPPASSNPSPQQKYTGYSPPHTPTATDSESLASMKLNDGTTKEKRDVEATHVNILIDCCKTFRETALRWFVNPTMQPALTHLDALLLTHEHADAILGLDDIRTVQPYGIAPLPIYGSPFTLKGVRERFPYLDSTFRELTLQKSGVYRKVSELDFREFTYFQPFDVHGLSITPISVLHGSDYECSAFVFGNKQRVVYISDVSDITEKTMKYLKSIGHIDILVLDALLRTRYHNTHINATTAFQYVEELKPDVCYLTGLSDNWLMERDALWLKKVSKEKGFDVRLGYDGLLIEVDL